MPTPILPAPATLLATAGRGPQDGHQEGPGGQESCMCSPGAGGPGAQKAEGSGPGPGNREVRMGGRGVTHHSMGGGTASSHLESREMTEEKGPGKAREEAERNGEQVPRPAWDRREGRGAGPLTLSEGVHLEARHFLGQDGLGQVEEGGVVDREVMVILLQDPHCHSLDAVGETAGGGGRRDQQGGPGRETSGQVGRAGKDKHRDKLFPRSLAQGPRSTYQARKPSLGGRAC